MHGSQINGLFKAHGQRAGKKREEEKLVVVGIFSEGNSCDGKEEDEAITMMRMMSSASDFLFYYSSGTEKQEPSQLLLFGKDWREYDIAIVCQFRMDSLGGSRLPLLLLLLLLQHWTLGLHNSQGRKKSSYFYCTLTSFTTINAK